ncbi:MAG: M28 family peptidase, partial [Pirellulales bacterium]
IDWRPVSFSRTGKVPESPIVFAGYGISAPQAADQEEYDSYVHLDVTGKWVLVFRYMPEQITPERRQHLSRYSSLRFKTMLARDKGARGIIVVSGPTSKVNEQLVALRLDGTLSGSSLPVISVKDRVAEHWLAAAGKNLQTIQEQLDRGEMMMGFEIPDVRLGAEIAIRKVKRKGRNVLARLPAGSPQAQQAILVGAHVDHLGTGSSSSSLARGDERDEIHYGADDNASGVAALIEIAEYLSHRKSVGKFKPQRDILFAAWSGEELGLLGASHFAKSYPQSPAGHTTLYPAIAACLNMDMVGRLDKNLILQGVGSSSIWRMEIERRNAPVGLPILLQEDSYLPTDASVFYLRGVPILSAFTGSHSDYHTPRDTPDKLNYDGMARVARLVGLVARSLTLRDEAPDYVAQTAPKEGQRRAHLRAHLGTIPDYAEETQGVKLSGVAKEGPAAKAGLRSGDVIVELAGKKIENIYDYTYAIEALKIGEKVRITVLRNGRRVTSDIIPGSRE